MGKMSGGVIFIWIWVAGSIATMAAGRAEDRFDLELGGSASLIALLVWWAIYRKQRAARDLVYAAKMEQINATPAIHWRLQRNRAILPVLVPALIIAFLLIWLLRQLQPTTPMLAGLRDADLQRIGLVMGLLIALAGYGMFRLLRRGDSGSG